MEKLQLIIIFLIIVIICSLFGEIKRKNNNSQDYHPQKKNKRKKPKDFYPPKVYNKHQPQKYAPPKKQGEVLEENTYYNSAYYKQTLYSYLDVTTDKGKYGEYLIYDCLKYYENTGAKFLFNCYLYKDNGQTTEIDVIMIHSSGIFVFESKNYSGWIFGNEKASTWTQTLAVGRGKPAEKEHFYNPIRQNELHISCLKKMLGDKIPMHSIVVFSERCTFKDLKIESSAAQVIKRDNLCKVVDKIVQQSKGKADMCNVTNTYNMLYPYSQVSERVKQQHIENIQRDLERQYREAE